MLSPISNTQLAPIVKQNNLTKVSILGKDSIHLGYNITNHIANELPTISKFSKLVIITDTHLKELHLTELKAELSNSLSPKGIKVYEYIISPGEQSKSRKYKAEIEDYLFSIGCTRDTLLLGLGGGVIGDLVGYVASTFMRGVPVVHLPTSLLAMVDSSIGGKTAIDVPSGKNLIGSFWQPLRVYVDLKYLQTLPKREFFNGMAEVIKTAAIADAEEFNRLEKQFESIQRLVVDKENVNEVDRLALEKVVLSSIRFKAFVVTEDEKESGLRGLLNFGHSIGHAIEAILSPSLLHGECVSIGMIQEAEVARSLGHINQVTIARLSRVLKLYNLPISVYDSILKNKLSDSQRQLNVEKLMNIIKLDKKNVAGKKRIVLLKEIGGTTNPYPEFVNDEELIRAMSYGIQINLKETLDSQQYSEVSVPGSKSISNRALLLAALGEGTIKLSGLLHSDDTQVMLEALRLLGNVQYEFQDGGENLVIHGCGGPANFKVPNQPIYLGNAGTAVRFLTTICASVKADEGSIILTGNERMKQRPIGPLVNALRDNGCQINYLEGEGCLPLKFESSGKNSGLKGGVIELAADISSQYVSSILLSSPYTKEGVTLKLVGGHVISQPYIDMTISMMKQFGVNVERKSTNEYFIPSSKYINPSTYLVEGDASSATYPLSLAAITGTTVKVNNLGYDSLQGDAQFALNVLKPMGCEVTQTSMTTTVKGPAPGNLICLPQIDMEPMTDAFLTASVLAAVATKHPTDQSTDKFITNITGIANQRVKECNRILAMVTELAKFGVYCEELEDGISIYGTKLSDLKLPVDGIDCYDDHRVAMSFSLIGTQVPGTIIKEKRCIEKTYPGWWDVLRHLLNVPLSGYDIQPHHDIHSNQVDINKSIILIGMRGVGKTTLGEYLADDLGYQFLDLDYEFEKVYKVPVKQLVAEKGWEEFRQLEAQLVKDSFNKYSKNTVISCGGGIVELEENRQLLLEYKKKGGLVLFLKRDINDIETYLNVDSTRPNYSNEESIKDVYLRRLPYYQQCSSHEFVSISKEEVNNNSQQLHFQLVKNQFTKFIQFLQGKIENPVKNINKNSNSFFVCINNSNVKEVLTDLKEIAEGSHAVEIRVDQLIKDKDLNSTNEFQLAKDYIIQQISLLKYELIDYPIIYTLRTINEGGSLPDDLPVNQLLELSELGLRLGCEVIDLQLNFNNQIHQSIQQNKRNSLILASYHDLSGNLEWDTTAVTDLIKKGQSYGDIVKLISTAKDHQYNLKLLTFLNEYYNNKSNTTPLIAINMGEKGKITRVLNPYLTPVTHPKLSSKAAPGQLSSKEILNTQYQLGSLTKKEYYLFGNPISSSPTPQFHTAVFQSLGYPHELHRHQTDDIEKVNNILKQDNFGGSCVTIPFKVQIIPYLDELCPIAKSLGAVNTVIRQNGKLKGYNTDWLGIHDLLSEKLLEINALTKKKSAIILGAGGTSRAAIYALNQLNFETIFVYNRSLERVEELRKEVDENLKFVSIIGQKKLDELIQQDNHNIVTIVDTLPGDSQVVNESFLKQVFKENKGILVKLAYAKYSEGKTSKVENQYGDNIQVVDGLDILIVTARYQTKLWTNGVQPRSEFAKKTMNQIVYGE
ncbi:Pentafunctional AroM protein [Neoconidiobolus thromboides FSU 785]|nr:Pentafunctional AroM protein [Neoconidiobolus thromboides FSU 785]